MKVVKPFANLLDDKHLELIFSGVKKKELANELIDRRMSIQETHLIIPPLEAP